MPVSTFDVGDKFRFTVIKHHVNNPLDFWANTYEAISNDGGALPEIAILRDALVAFEQTFHFDSTIFDRIITATWEPDSAPYTPENFVSQPLGSTGFVMAATGAVGLTTCLHVTRNPSFGRYGHLFYRNCLTESDVSAPSGIDVLTNQVTMNATLQAAVASSDLSDHLGFGPSAILMLCMIDAAGTMVRQLSGLSVAGVAHVKSDHKWYNRTGGV